MRERAKGPLPRRVKEPRPSGLRVARISGGGDDGRTLLDTRRALLAGRAPAPLIAGTNTTIGVIATDAVLTKVQATRMAQVGHDGLARSINPVHTLSDGDTLFALADGNVKFGHRKGRRLVDVLPAE